MDISVESARGLLEKGMNEAQELIKDPSKIDSILIQLENKLKEVPAIGEQLSDIPLMVSMVKGYITKEYTDVSPKVIATMVAAFIYLIKGKDLIPDKIPVVGVTDDVGVLALAFQFCKPELEAYKEFRDGKRKETE